MNKKQILTVLIITVITAALVSLAVIKYHDRPRTTASKPSITVGQVQAQLKASQAQVTSLNSQNATAKAQVSQLTDQKTALCTQIKSLKQTNAVCQ